MKVTFTKTTILFLCTVLGLTIGISSAFGQKLVDQSQIKGEVPIDQPNFNQKKELVPEHLKPNQTEKPNESSPPPVKGEKPVDMPRDFNHSKRLAPETNTPKSENKPSEQPTEPNPKTGPPTQEKPKEQPTENNSQNKENHTPSDQKELDRTKKDAQDSPVGEDQSSSKEETKKQPSSDQQDHEPNSVQDEESSQRDHKEPVNSDAKDKGENEVEIPQKVEIESSDGKTVDITSVIQDIFGQVNSSKEETEEIQKQMENEQPDPKVALQEPNRSSSEQEGSKRTEESKIEEYDRHNPPRTVEHGLMPMTASNDLHGVLIGLAMALVGALYVLFRKGEQV